MNEATQERIKAIDKERQRIAHANRVRELRRKEKMDLHPAHLGDPRNLLSSKELEIVERKESEYEWFRTEGQKIIAERLRVSGYGVGHYRGAQLKLGQSV